MMTIIDIKDMPGYNPVVANGIDSVSTGKVTMQFHPLANGYYPTCERHGSLLKVSKYGIWRCGELHCSNGCFQVNN